MFHVILGICFFKFFFVSVEGTESMIDRYNEDNPTLFLQGLKLETLVKRHCPLNGRGRFCLIAGKFVNVFVNRFLSAYHDFVGRTMEFATSDGSQIWSNPNASQCVNAARRAGSWKRYTRWRACSMEVCIMDTCPFL